MKDNFSAASHNYARYRPSYPDELFVYLQTLLTGNKNAWDCATGNGQAAQKLSPLFQQVYATDISPSQLEQAIHLPNIQYSVQPAEKTNFPDAFFDLVMVAQAVHWFRFDDFYAEVARTAKPGALIVVTGYGRVTIIPELDSVINTFYTAVVGPYWDKERRYIDEAYQTIPFPFQEIPSPNFSITYQWTLDHLLGYLQTWSAVKHYQNKNGSNPVDLVQSQLRKNWGGEELRTVCFPLLLRVGKIHAG
ncbi:MAG TPA: class I SAM-dependent methyltransferase [Flavisolibacter sp.]|jgi:SAM-dependent methyltransferase|nr:class I SAM-dependent methyltransferase [Flavisolibacter sp.]